MSRLEELFEANEYGKYYLKSINDCKEKLKELIQRNTPLFNFTDHGIKHSDRINERIYKLFCDMLQNKDRDIKLNNSELYSLILAIYLHDIGMELINKKKVIGLFTEKKYKNKFLLLLSSLISVEEIGKIDENSADFYDFIRNKHHIISAMWIMKNNVVGDVLKLPIIDDYLSTVALICFAHNEDLSILDNEFYNNGQADECQIQVKILAYLLRVGDSLDADKRRCNIDILEVKDIEVISRVHWYRHFYTKSIICDNKIVKILFEFPEGDRWLENIQDFFMRETVYWISKNYNDIIENKIFEGNKRNNFLTYTIEEKVDFGIKKLWIMKQKK
ncbi:hypothetical protein [Clostridium estertheticum]|uniref:HD-CE domain-containing protein n=1 Tax=Clostridium estertheticum TaxID=238834 RepID=A0AA47I4P4_9CLOT|nr:hypothetical protein [Clostridium estertheticum]MBU3155004.1 hypothetical protein [Clostridium estertheticum]WAG58823.1 hypothetical protein LL038_14290 [Clostridium estertheticum]